MLHFLLKCDRQCDELQISQNLPPWELYRKLQQRFGNAKNGIALAEPDDPAIDVARHFLVRFQRATIAQIGVDRRIAALRCVEAIRLYASANDGKLPPNLAAIKGMKLPVDPLTGTPFEYTVTDKTAVLKGNVLVEDKNERAEPLAYEITIRQ
jgi:hypothetical protein